MISLSWYKLTQQSPEQYQLLPCGRCGYNFISLLSPLLRVLKAFLSRTAQRVPYMSSLHLLRILGVMLMTVSWFLCAWTVGVLQNRDRNIPVFVTGTTSDGQGFNLCYLDRWDYMMAVGKSGSRRTEVGISEVKSLRAAVVWICFGKMSNENKILWEAMLTV